MQDQGANVPEINVELRQFEPGDTNFVFHTWLKSYRKRIHSCADRLYYPNQQSVIARICQEAQCVVACNRDDPSFILSYVVGVPCVGSHRDFPMTAHYAFTKLSYRRLGIARALLKQLGWVPRRPVYVTHWTRSCRELQDAKKFQLVNYPFGLMDLPNV